MNVKTALVSLRFNISTPGRRSALFELKFSQDIGHIVIFHLKSIQLTLGVKEGARGGQKGGWGWEGGSEYRSIVRFDFIFGHKVYINEYFQNPEYGLGTGYTGGFTGGLGRKFT